MAHPVFISAPQVDPANNVHSYLLILPSPTSLPLSEGLGDQAAWQYEVK